jgi:peroxiredoxin family protein
MMGGVKSMVDKTTIIVHSGDMDKLYSALIIANGALSFGMDVSLYFTFWGLERLTKDGLDKGQLSKMDMGESGMQMMINRMKQANLASLETLIQDFKELGGKIIACEMTMEIMGITKEHLRQELIDEYGAVGTYIKEARESNINLFI